MPNPKSPAKTDAATPDWVPYPFRISAERLNRLGIGVVFSRNNEGSVFARLLRYENGVEDDEALLRNAAAMSDDDWADYLRPAQAWLTAAPEPMRGKGALMLMPIETIQADDAPCLAWFLSPESPEDLPHAIREAIASEPEVVDEDLIDFEVSGADVDLDNLTLTFDEEGEHADPLLAGVSRAWLPAHPFSDPDDLALARALSRDVGHGRRLLISGDLLTAGERPRLIDRYDFEALIDDLCVDYDLTDPRGAAHILGRENAEDIAQQLLMDAGGADGDEDLLGYDVASIIDEQRPRTIH